jgi:hypothetical protein
LARSQGFLDPVGLLARLHEFAQPSEVNVPIELLRAGAVFHARGLINSRAMQHNLDWVWPFWVERQFDPRDDAFVPRAFSITHVNLTHRNWTAVGLPDSDWYPLVDPRGMVTPHEDSWSIDCWIVPDDGTPLLPSRCDHATQRLLVEDRLAVETTVLDNHGRLHSCVEVLRQAEQSHCRIDLQAIHEDPAWLAVAIRPANPEGVSFIHEIAWRAPKTLIIGSNQEIHLSQEPDRVCMSDYRRGDVFQDIGFREAAETASVEQSKCDVGLATAAALFRMAPAEPLDLTIHVPESNSRAGHPTARQLTVSKVRSNPWKSLTEGACELQSPDPRFNFVFDAAIRSLLLHTSIDVYPGPYTYRRFWFRDAAFILNALLAIGFTERVQKLLDLFPERQTQFGYFQSQEGEWDSNGEVIWLIDRFRQFGGMPLSDTLIEAVRKGARWIIGKRLAPSLDAPHAGLMPAGFSAEHLGPNDHYYWDDFWSAAGLQSAARILHECDQHQTAQECREEAKSLMRSVDQSIAQTASHRDRLGVPASPYRRMDSGAIGSLAAGYPLHLWDARDRRLLDTSNFLLTHCLVNGGFFQDMIHSGINAYLTLQLAQVLLRAGDARHADLTQAVANIASSTGQWPEAIHPRTGGGCMGTGQAPEKNTQHQHPFPADLRGVLREETVGLNLRGQQSLQTQFGRDLKGRGDAEGMVRGNKGKPTQHTNDGANDIGRPGLPGIVARVLPILAATNGELQVRVNTSGRSSVTDAVRDRIHVAGDLTMRALVAHKCFQTAAAHVDQLDLLAKQRGQTNDGTIPRPNTSVIVVLRRRR